MHHLAWYLCVLRQASNLRRALRGMIMKVCKMMKMHRARMIVAGVSLKVDGVSLSSTSISPRASLNIFFLLLRT